MYRIFINLVLCVSWGWVGGWRELIGFQLKWSKLKILAFRKKNLKGGWLERTDHFLVLGQFVKSTSSLLLEK